MIIIGVKSITFYSVPFQVVLQVPSSLRSWPCVQVESSHDVGITGVLRLR